MCGRFLNLNKSNFIKRMFSISGFSNENIISYNISPSQIIQIITNIKDINLEIAKWGYAFIDKKINSEKIVINSRLETIKDKLLFKDSFQKRKCIIPANGYYEWSINNQNIKIPYLIHLPTLEPIYFAGIWKYIDFKTTSNKTFSIITKSSNSYISNIHNRMPVILSKDEALCYLEDNDNNFLNINFISEVEEYLEFYKLNKFVNNPNNNTDKCIEPLT